MRFMVMVKATRDSEAGVMPSTELIKAGVLIDGGGLQSSAEGARVRFNGSKRTVTDGPFAETKDLVAGYWIFEVKSLQEAIDWVKRAPNPHPGESEIEIRRMFEPEEFENAPPELVEQEKKFRSARKAK